MTFKDKLTIYIYNKGNSLEEEFQQIQTQCRFSPLDSLDHFELMNAKIRLNAFKEFIDELMKIIVYCK